MHAASRHGTPSLTSFPKDGKVSCEVRPQWSPIRNLTSLDQALLSPAVIALKVLFQKVLKDKIDWDSPVSEENKTEFRRIIKELKSGGCIEIDRSYLNKTIPLYRVS